MKKQLLTYFLLVIATVLQAQQKATQLRQELLAAKTDSAKIDAYIELIGYFSTRQPDTAEYYGLEGLQYASKHNYAIGEGLIVEKLGKTDRNAGRMDLAKKRLTHALNIFRKVRDTASIARALTDLGALEAITSNYNIATQCLVSALKMLDTSHYNESLMTTYFNLGALHMQHDDTANAAKYLYMAEHVSREIPLTDASISLYNTIGVLRVVQGDSASALETFLHNLELSTKSEFVNAHVECLSYLAQFYLDKGQPEKALDYLKEGLDLASSRNIEELKANMLLQMASVLQEKNPSKALEYFKEAETMAKAMNNMAFLVLVYDQLAAFYKASGNFKDALTALENKQEVVNSTFSLNRSMEIAGISYEYELEQSKAKQTALEERNHQRVRERNIFIGVAIVIIISLGILAVYYRRSILLNKKLEQREKELRDLNATKDKLFSIIGHDLRGPIANIITVLELYEDESTGEDEKKFIIESLREHSKLSLETLDKLLFWGKSLMKGNRMNIVDFNTNGYIKEAIEFRKASAAEKGITVIDEVPDPTFVHADQAHFDFIIRNLLTNAIKYTNTGGTIKIMVNNNAKPGFVVFAVKDNGVGMDAMMRDKLFKPVSSSEGTAREKGNGIGLMLCREFAMHNGGDIWAESEEGKGSTFYFSLRKGAAQ